MEITKKQIAAYALLPGLFPRFSDLFTKGFGWIAYLIAHIYHVVRLLPQGHPYLKAENNGKFGLRQVIAAAANNVRFEWKYIDQILMFGVVILGVVLLFAQFILLIFTLIFSQAQAGMFETANPETDAAFMLLDFVFGIPGFYGSCALGTPSGPTLAPCAAIPNFGDPTVFAFHAGLHSLLEFYSWALLFVGVLIFLYFIVVMLAETASTGVPFGARFNTAWAPIRLLVAIGLLLPITYGLNSGQYLTLAIAKLGSGLATNAWLGYNNTVMNAGTLGPFKGLNFGGHVAPGKAGVKGASVSAGLGHATLLPRPTTPDVSPFVSAIQVIKACEYAYRKAKDFTQYGPPGPNHPTEPSFRAQAIRPWLVKPGADPIPLTNEDNSQYLSITRTGTGPTATFSSGAVINDLDPLNYPANTVYDMALEFFDFGDVIITFGAPAPQDAADFDPNTIIPYCGTIALPTITSTRIPPDPGGPVLPGTVTAAGAWYVQKRYYQLIMSNWADGDPSLLSELARRNTAHAARYAEARTTGLGEFYRPCVITSNNLNLDDADGFDPAALLAEDRNIESQGAAGANASYDQCNLPPSSVEKNDLSQDIRQGIQDNINTAWENLLEIISDEFELSVEVQEKGWAAAGMWYNQLAGIIGREFDAAGSIPYLASFPVVMDQVRNLRGSADLNVTAIEVFNPRGVSDDRTLNGAMQEIDVDIARVLYHVFKDWSQTGVAASDISVVGDMNILTRGMHAIFGTRNIMSIREETFFEVHPMAQLIAIGKDLVNSTLTNVIGSAVFSIGGGIYEASGATYSAGVASAISSALSSIALVGLTAGFILFYILPFMPFLYFFFGVATWVKTIFEAMVGVPLWALAHIRIDSEGLPGDAAANGYFLLLEIFVRPILMIFALIGSFIIFGALVRVLNETFGLVVDNAMGFEDQMFAVDLGFFTLDLSNARNVIDEFFFTIIYVLTVYILALSSFKLIDQIPDKILRWAGAGVKSFGDTYEDPAAQLTQYAAVGGFVVGERAIGGINSLGKSIGTAGGALGSRLPGGQRMIEMSNPLFRNEIPIARHARGG